MHLYTITRGIKKDVDEFIKLLQGVFLPYKFETKKGKIENGTVQIQVRPIQLWEIVFPEEHKDLILTTVLGGQNSMKGITNQKKHRKFVSLIRKALGVEKIPDYDMSKVLPCAWANQNTEVVGVGIKEDYKINGLERL